MISHGLKVACTLVAVWVGTFAFESRADYGDMFDAMVVAEPTADVVEVADLSLSRGELEFTFESGRFHFFEPLNGMEWGAVFIGKGFMSLDPADPRERLNLQAMQTGDSTSFSDSIPTALLLFSDDTAAQIRAKGTVVESADSAEAVNQKARYIKSVRGDFFLDYEARVLQDLSGTTEPGFFRLLGTGNAAIRQHRWIPMGSHFRIDVWSQTSRSS